LDSKVSQKCNTPGPVWKPQFLEWVGRVKWWKTVWVYIFDLGSFIESFLADLVLMGLQWVAKRVRVSFSGRFQVGK